MLLTSASAHAIRAMIYLARQPDRRFCRAKEISEFEEIPNPFLWKILRQLCGHHLLESLRGSGGGYRLGMEPYRIRLSDIVKAVEGDTNFDHCVLHEGECREAGNCSLHVCLKPVLEQLLNVMENTTLEAVVQTRAVGHSRRLNWKRTKPKA